MGSPKLVGFNMQSTYRVWLRNVVCKVDIFVLFLFILHEVRMWWTSVVEGGKRLFAFECKWRFWSKGGASFENIRLCNDTAKRGAPGWLWIWLINGVNLWFFTVSIDWAALNPERRGSPYRRQDGVRQHPAKLLHHPMFHLCRGELSCMCVRE